MRSQTAPSAPIGGIVGTVVTVLIAGGMLLSVSLLSNALMPPAAGAPVSKTPLPTLQGEKSVEQLMQTGQYDSLMGAVKAARKGDGQADEPQTNDAFWQRAKLTAADGGFDDRFGISVAISGETAIVGAYLNDVSPNGGEGSAYIFVRSGATWSLQQKLTASDGAGLDFFGGSVGLSGETAIVGAYADDLGANTNQGSAYIFVRSGTTWSEQQKLTAADGAPNDSFGFRVAISNETAIVGAFGDDFGANTNQGSAYTFIRSGTTWSQQQKLTASDGGNAHQFGISVAISGETAIVGASNNESAYIFVRSGTTWSQQQKLIASDGATNDVFGTGVAISGETAIVGATGHDVGANINQGSAYIFTRAGTTWREQQKLTATDGAADDRFGRNVAISAETAIVATTIDDVGANTDQGSAYVFARSGTTWSEQQKLTAADGAANDNFGTGVALSGNNIFIGAQADDVGANIDQGSAYVFHVVKVPFDFDGDGKTDVGIFRPGPAEWWYQRSSDGQVPAFQFGAATDAITPADYTGDGKTDIAFWRPSSGEWFILRSENGSFFSFPFGANGDIPTPADYDNDGRADPAVFRPSNATWYIQRSSDQGTTFAQFGATGDHPVAADYDADGRGDIAIYRPSNGQWWLNRSTAGVIAMSFGDSNDKPVQGDYTGDGKDDVGFWRPSTGEWYILRSEDSSYYAVPFGATGDIPAPGDYDGDGKIDTTVFRPSSATWFVQRSTAGTLIQQFGANGDRPLSNAFVP